MKNFLKYLHNVDWLVRRGVDRKNAAIDLLQIDMPELWEKIPDEFRTITDDETLRQFGAWLTKMTRANKC